MANSVSVNTSNKDLWAGGAEPYKASYGKLMMWLKFYFGWDVLVHLMIDIKK